MYIYIKTYFKNIVIHEQQKKKRDEQKYTDSIWPEYKGKNKQREETPLWS